MYSADKTYANTNWREIIGKVKNSYMASKLKESAGERYKSRCVDSVEWEAAEHINELELRLSEQKDIEKRELRDKAKDIADGGAALTAYGKLQYSEMNNKERLAITDSLLRYCELDTLAMVMIYEHLKELVN